MSKKECGRIFPSARGHLTVGILYDSYRKLRGNLFDRVDPGVHERTYEGIHDPYYAEPEFTGKYIDICMQYYLESGDCAALDSAGRVVEGILRNQRADGYLGTFAPGAELEAFSIWNQSFTVLGLIAFWDVTGDGRALRTANRCVDYIAGQFLGENPPDVLEAINNGSENLVVLLAASRLYGRTGLESCRRLIEHILHRLERSDMNMVSFEDMLALRSRKGIEMLLAFLGLLEYGAITGNEALIEAARRYWRQINDHQIRETGNGTIGEFWTEGGNAPANLPVELRPNENCVAVGWFELSAALFAIRPEAKYLDAMEKTLFNHVLGALSRDGSDFAYYQGNLGKKLYSKEKDLYQCCRYRGLTLFSHLPETLYYHNADTLIPAIYASSGFTARFGGIAVDIRQETDYPADGEIIVTVDARGAADFILKLRIPEWCGRWEALVDGAALNAIPIGGFIDVGPRWKPGKTVVTLRLDMTVRTAVAAIEGEKHAAVQYGPLLLALDSHFGTPIDSTRIRLESGRVTLRREQPEPGASLVAFTCDGEVNGVSARLTLVDYASAGSIDYASDAFRVWTPVCDCNGKGKGAEQSI